MPFRNRSSSQFANCASDNLILRNPLDVLEDAISGSLIKEESLSAIFSGLCFIVLARLKAMGVEKSPSDDNGGICTGKAPHQSPQVSLETAFFNIDRTVSINYFPFYSYHRVSAHLQLQHLFQSLVMTF